MFSLLHHSAAELLAILSTITLLFILVGEIYEYLRGIFGYEAFFFLYNYRDLVQLLQNFARPYEMVCRRAQVNMIRGYVKGPAKWKDIFPASKGRRQSPINISSAQAVVIVENDTANKIRFSTEYHSNPCELRAYNDNNCVIICGKWIDARPYVCGGPLLSAKYQFFNARFRWGADMDNGSEHTIDHQRFAMELQVTHLKVGKTYANFQAAAEARALLIVTYFFQITPMDNPYLKPLVNALSKIISPFSYCALEPTPLSWFAPPFGARYFSYKGSLTFPPCTEGVRWLIQPEPLAISIEQLNKFRMLQSVNGPIETNTRPVQNVNGRDICFYD